MLRAVYSPEKEGHYALASECYTHFTSPIRRYPDLVVHRVLRLSRQGADAERREEIAEDMPETARHTSERERRANDAERELVQWKKVRFMADKVGDEFEGYITGVSAYGLYVELVEHFVEGMVHVSTMADDYYRFVERAHILRGENTRREYRLGDRVTVQVVRVDLEQRQIDLGLSEILSAVGRARPGRATRRPGRAAPSRTEKPRRTGKRPAGKRPAFAAGRPRRGRGRRR
jgi:ribonuclease R